jgi:hypothetical protein
MTARRDNLPESGVRSYLFQRTPDHRHQGIDLPATKGASVSAALGGVVAHAANVYTPGFSGYGRVVVVAADDGTYHLYAHLDHARVAKGQQVRAGDVIGFVGNSTFSRTEPTRESGGAHLHFEVSPTKYPRDSEAPRIDPVPYLRAGRVHPLTGLVLGEPTIDDTANTPSREPLSGRPLAGSPQRPRCPCCGQPLPGIVGGVDDNRS